ncbi:MAG: glutathione S-transferase N-terminal domain-containing protein [Bradymonadaceae bacterium]|nr:glutathione S-transferase N-terminal domain-containing protein [Lujinxingiaceae bacterium]
MSANNAQSWMASVMRGGRGLKVSAYSRENPPRPAKRLELYDFEGCPFCRKVRDVLTELDLEFIERTCAKGASTKRAFVVEQGGQSMFPYLIDPNTDTRLYESEDIINYLMSTYSPGRSAIGRALSPIDTASSMSASIVRPRGSKVRDGLGERDQPPELLELYNFEASPYCRKVREAMCELNLDYVVKNVGKGSKRRAEFKALAGRVMVPYLVDPNTGTQMFESDEIVAYLEKTYG